MQWGEERTRLIKMMKVRPHTLYADLEYGYNIIVDISQLIVYLAPFSIVVF